MKKSVCMRALTVFVLLLTLLCVSVSALAAKWPQQVISAAEYPVEKNGSYTSMEEVAVYLATYGKLPGNFLTKNEAEAAGWDSRSGNLDRIAPGKSIGGSHFGNYEGSLPDGKWTECDVNYFGGYRGSERILFSKDGLIYYTNDHYNTFTQLLVDFSEQKAEEPKQEKKSGKKDKNAEVITVTDELLASIDEYGEYDTPAEVAAYLHLYGTLPCNYLTRDEAKELGWSSKKDNLGSIMPGCSIGGEVFENREGLLPAKKGRTWLECDVNTQDGKRSKQRIVYSNDGLIYYTPDNHKTFTQIY